MTSAETTITENAAAVAEQSVHAAPEKVSSKKGASPKKGAPRARKPPRAAKPRPLRRGTQGPERRPLNPPAPRKPARRAPRAREQRFLELIGRPKGATLAEIMKAPDWQKHSIRGFLSTAAKKHSLKIESTKTEAGDRVYQVKK
jgi:hypothetical protein